MANVSAKEKVAAGEVDPQDEKVQKDVAAEQKVHADAAQRRTAYKAEFDNYDDAEKDYQEKQQKLAEALAEAQAAEQALPELKVQLQQKYVDELKAQGVEYAEDGRQLGITGEPVSNPTLYGGNPAPDTLGKVH